MNFIHRHLRNRVIKKYAFELTPLLVKRYGIADQYTVGQIESTLKESKFTARYIRYAIAIFRQEESSKTIEHYQLNQQALDQTRCQLAPLLNLTPDYSVKDIIALMTSESWQGGQHHGGAANRSGRTWF